ncbi:ATP synthase mitochondrial F1 complex assembly factor 2-like [Liolophura sinensis]|uniref:ATP synthase mitochondrial F1 complex assembly factor 2-like n=1 Tax=Liolophura sinensis TaxID=3198878 RepID=UPI0031586346
MAAPLVKVCRQASAVYLSNCLHNRSFCVSAKRFSVRELKKFYKLATISQANGGLYEINLDKRKLKTPAGTLFQVPSEALALAVATEWNMQESIIKRHTMYLTALCNTAIDNPSRRSQEDTVGGIIHFLETDTVCYRVELPVELANLQSRLWDPLINWFAHRHDVHITTTTGFSPPQVSAETVAALRKYLLSFGDWAVHGFQSGVETLKSLIIMLALVDKEISVENAVKLARLEQEFQIDQWGNVEWAHDLDREEMKARLSAAALFVHWCSEGNSSLQKLKDSSKSVAS